MPSCTVVDCPNRQYAGSEKTFHLFPFSQPNVLKQWLANMKRELWTPSKRAVLCSDHFEESCFDRTGSTTRIQAKAVPTLFSDTDNQRKTSKKIEDKRGRTKGPIPRKKSTSANGLELNPELQEASESTSSEVRCSKRIPKRKWISPDYEYDKGYLKQPRIRLQDQVPLRQRVVSLGRRKRAALSDVSSKSEGSSIDSEIPSDCIKEEVTHKTKVVGDGCIVQDRDLQDGVEENEENSTESTLTLENDVRPIERAIKKEKEEEFEEMISALHKITPKDKVTHLPNNFIHFEFATPRRHVILELNSNVEASGLRCTTLQDLLSSLKDKDLLTREAEDLMNAFGDLPKGLLRLNKKKGLESMFYKRHSEEVKQFATLLFLNSPESYDLVSNIFMLPEKYVIKARLKVEDYWPGFTKEALRILSNHMCRTPQDKLCSVMFDFINVRTECSFDDSCGKWIGHVDLGASQTPCEADEIPLASEVLLFTAVGLGSDWKLPFGYFLSKGLSPEFLKNLVVEVILTLEECGLSVRAVVCNGTANNIKLGKLFGCIVHPRISDEMMTSFPHPGDQERRIYLVFGIRHCLQLLRNLLDDKGILQSSVYGKIEWKYLRQLLGESERKKPDRVRVSPVGRQLLEESESKKSDRVSPVGPSHLRFYNLQRIIEKSGSVFNSTVSCALYLASQLKLEEYDQCSATANFTADVHRAFDIMNARNPTSSGDRPPIHWITLLEQMESITNVAERILGLELSSGKHVAEDGRWMSVVLFAFTLKSVSYLASDLLNEKSLQYFKTYRVNVDHIDMVANHLHRHGDWSDVPSCAEFRNAYRNLFVQSPDSNFYGYDFDGEDLTIGQGSIYLYRNNFNFDNIRESAVTTLHSTHLLDLKTDSMNKANCVLQKILQQLSCPDCVKTIMNDNLPESSGKTMDNASSVRPSGFLGRLLKDSETFLKVELVKSELLTLEHLVLRVFSGYFDLHENLNLPKRSITHYIEEPYHIICLVKNVIRTFIRFRVHEIKDLRSKRQF